MPFAAEDNGMPFCGDFRAGGQTLPGAALRPISAASFNGLQIWDGSGDDACEFRRIRATVRAARKRRATGRTRCG